MEWNKNLSKNLKVLHSETLFRDDNDAPEKISFHCDFFGELMIANISKSDIQRDWNSITGEGDSELWDSFNDQIENKHWDEMKEMFRLHEENEE